METTNIHIKGNNISIVLETFSFINLNTITNTIIIQKSKVSGGHNLSSDVVTTVKKESFLTLNVNNKK